MRCWQRLDKKLRDKKFKMEMQTEQICFTAADKMWMYENVLKMYCMKMKKSFILLLCRNLVHLLLVIIRFNVISFAPK
jgi:hypothetical protein